MAEKIIMKDEQVLHFDNNEERLRIQAERKEENVWLPHRLGDLRCVVVPDNPMFLSDVRKEHCFGSEVPDEAIEDCMAGTRLAILDESGSIPSGIPLRACAVQSVEARAGVGNARLLRDLLKRGECQKAADIINTGFDLYKDAVTQTLFSDGKYSGLHSARYEAMEYRDLSQAGQEILEADYAGWRFVKGEMSHECDFALYDLSSRANELLGPINRALKAKGMDPVSGTPLLLTSTSDVTESGSNIIPYLETENGKRIPLGRKLGLYHQKRLKGTCLEAYRTNFSLVGKLFDQAVEDYEHMAGIRLRYPVDAMRNACLELKLPVKACADAIMEFDATRGRESSALDVYFALFNVELGVEKMADVAEARGNIVRAMGFKWDELDTPYYIKGGR